MTFTTRTANRRGLRRALLLEIEGIEPVLVEREIRAPVVTSYDLDEAPYAYFQMESGGGGGTLPDTMGNVSTNATTATMGSAGGIVDNYYDSGGNACDLSGLTSTTTLLASSSAFSVAFWVYFNPGLETRFPITQYHGEGARKGWYLERSAADSKVTLAVEGIGSCVSTSTFGAAWKHITVVIDNNTLSSRLYVNGTLEGTLSMGSTMLPANASMIVAGWPLFAVNWYGSIDELLIFRRVLSTTEITNIKNAGLSGRAVTWSA